MDAKFLIDNKGYSLDFSKFHDLSIPINFNGEQPNTYGVDKAISTAYEVVNSLETQEKEVHVISKLILLPLTVMARIQNVLGISLTKEFLFYPP